MILCKKINCIFLFFLLIFFISSIFLQPQQYVFAESDQQYARIISSDVKMYRSTSGSEDYSNIFFVIPRTYFVILEPCDDDNFYAATYLNEKGYVKRSEVQCVSGKPTKAFAENISFRIFIPGGVDLRSSPTQSAGLNVLDHLQFLETNLKYFGSINGEEAISYKSTVWYYCEFLKNGVRIKGYVYSAFCDMLTAIPENTEILTYIDEPDFETVDTSTGGQTNNELSSLPTITQVIIIVAVCLPCIFIIYLLFKPTKITAKVMEDAEIKDSKKSKKSKIKHHDYYEYKE